MTTELPESPVAQYFLNRIVTPVLSYIVTQNALLQVTGKRDHCGLNWLVQICKADKQADLPSH